MFFPEKMISIHAQDKVLEIGPGATPYPRSDVFLELAFNSDQEKVLQRGGGITNADFGNRPVHYYDGGMFPFQDDEFDYVICSHVLEHVESPPLFLDELFRVAKGRGYLEYPLVTYEYLYDFDVHLNFIKFDLKQNILSYLAKRKTAISEFSKVTALFHKTLECGWDDICSANKGLFFEGFEFDHSFGVIEAGSLDDLVPEQSLVTPKSTMRLIVNGVLNKLERGR